MFHSLGKRSRARKHVEICIPAYRAESFIERTLRCALGQSHSNISILVSVDQSEDATAEICNSVAKRESRIKLFVQEHRLGWAGNVNFLLDQVCAPFFFLYFHDDIIDSRYTELLLEAFDNAGVASCHCDMGTFGATSHVLVGREYLNSPVQRLATFLVAPKRGTPLRSLTSSRILDSKLRLPTNAAGGLGANEPYIMRLLASGPAVRVPQILYWRWNQREGGLTEGWKKLSSLERHSVFRNTIAAAIEVVDDFATTPSEREALIFCLYVNMMVRLRQQELANGSSEFLAAEELSSDFAGKVRPNGFSELGSEIEKWALGRHKVLLQLEDQMRHELYRQAGA
ncbi:MAG: glycosyltransferase family 2 protein [Hyphomicrobiales bacterium]